MDDTQDSDQLQLLSIFHFVVAGFTGLVSLFPLIHLAIGIGILNGAIADGNSGQRPPAFVGWVFVTMALIFIAIGITLAICIAVAGFKLRRRTGYLYCVVIAGIECIFMPFGTVLGVLTIMFLLRPSIKSLFGVAPAPTTPK